MTKVSILKTAKYNPIQDNLSKYESLDLITKGEYSPPITADFHEIVLAVDKEAVSDADFILHSPSLRAAQTAQIIKETLGPKAVLLETPYLSEVKFSLKDLVLQKEYEEQLKAFARKHPENVSANITFDLKLAQQIYAGSDIFLMPSRFEPCGLGQMIAMRYGTVPVVRATGGLADTVDAKVGFSFQKVEIMEFYNTLKEAIDLYHEKPLKWRKLQENCMKRDFSWDKSAQEYIGLYKKIVKGKKSI